MSVTAQKPLFEQRQGSVFEKLLGITIGLAIIAAALMISQHWSMR
jgi:hypothetical protein